MKKAELSDGALVVLAATAEICGAPLTKPALLMMGAELAAYPEAQVLAALQRCRRELPGRLSLAAVIDRIDVPAGDSWPTANEAWAMVGTANEARTLVCVDEAYQALGEVSELLKTDDVAARMAFLDAYRRLVDGARSAGRKPAWRVSLGHDKAERTRALTVAVERGWLLQGHAENLLGGERLASKCLPPQPPPGHGLKVLAGGLGIAAGAPERPDTAPPELKVAPTPSDDNATRAAELLAGFANPELAKQAPEERRREWGAKPVAQPEPAYIPPNREEVAAMRAAAKASAEAQEAAMTEWEARNRSSS